MFHCGTKACIMAQKKLVSCLWPGRDGLLNVGVCYKSLSSQKHIKGPREKEMPGSDIDTVGRVVHNFPTTASSPVLRLDSSTVHVKCLLHNINTMLDMVPCQWRALRKGHFDI